MLALASIAVRLLSSRRLVRLLGDPRLGRLEQDGVVVSARAARIGRAVERVAGRLPWRPVCLPQAIATLAMLRWRGIPCEGHLGVVSTAPFKAHAWVTVGPAVVQGGPVTGVTELASLRR